MYKHYIEINGAGEVIKGFSDAFENPTENSILLRETDQRHFYLNDFEFNPNIESRIDGYLYVWKYGEVSKKQ